uniref:CAAX prenyl protease n=1 Tax=Chlamydomonas leiostraca TaxID=1034604 RepID=A0A7S0RQZ8_9CHLO|mmetsp:Transcript_29418/g.75048  ORF Transcript_29418/g.75048 Transcript_29418/m.75048 type:complete len:461 (+) Transcript_29418:70-1452(+)|eukprot:CAMPEP_0202861270 /NCGR_PEP_ID=MMETSP1391-20130828/2730_1 /ASSEMBLY_ACC=CAM_ASM_000867 /TAXON_ID=1034604 /ORGANISM="Chlamydomonas leiostraca, Strain SAG 11-49" /LENGTH=460 /DNA_ID=CAMNT_0049540637 /DNA_START=66 /DNA_END=1448 /DNA_ORIENTATION=-
MITHDAFNAWLETLAYKDLFVGFTVAVFLFHKLLDLRQLRVLRRPNAPPELAHAFKDPDLYRKTQAYSIDKWWFGLAHSLFSLVETLTLIMLNAYPGFWALAGDVVARMVAQAGSLAGWLGLVGSDAASVALRTELAQSVVFMLLFSALSLATGLPWSVYSTFVLEARHGFNKTSAATFVTDTVKSVILGLVLLPPLVAGMTYILLVAGPYMPLYLFLFVLAVSLFFMTIYPTLIQPLFNKFEPLPEGPLRDAIEGLASTLHFPLTKLYTMDGSRRSAHSNAYMYGFFKNKRIVLFDTLVAQCSKEEVVAVLAHELGHWKLRHTPVNFVAGMGLTAAQFCLLALVRSCAALYESFGFAPGVRPALVALVLFQLMVAPLDEVINFGLHVLSRTFEFQADGFAVKLGHGGKLKDALLRLEEENKGAMHVDPWYSAYHYSHPPLVERLNAIDKAVSAGAKKAL